MENLIWVIYLIDVICGDMVGLSMFCVMGFLFTLGMYVFVKCDVKNHKGENVLSEGFAKLKWGLSCCLFLIPLALSNFIPSKDTAYKMLAVYGVSEVAKNDNVQELMGDGYDILKLTLKDYKDKLEKGAVEEKQ